MTGTPDPQMTKVMGYPSHKVSITQYQRQSKAALNRSLIGLEHAAQRHDPDLQQTQHLVQCCSRRLRRVDGALDDKSGSRRAVTVPLQ